MVKHGTPYCYKLGCRLEECREARNAYNREYGAERRRGIKRTAVKVRAHTLPIRYVRIILYMYKVNRHVTIRELAEHFQLNQDSVETYIAHIKSQLAGVIYSRKWHGYWLSEEARMEIQKVLNQQCGPRHS